MPVGSWIGRGKGYRAWMQRGDRVAKPNVELSRSFSEDAFPGFAALVLSLAQIDTISASWMAALSATRRIYLLICPRTPEQYVGMASRAGSLLTRWCEYFATGARQKRLPQGAGPSDLRVSILQTIGSITPDSELLALGARWKDKMQSLGMGLNRN